MIVEANIKLAAKLLGHKVLVIVQARCSSKRFKNKVMNDIFGKPLIWHLIRRVQSSKKVSKIVVSSSNKKTDEKLINFLKKEKLDYFRGNLNNVAKRLYLTAAKNKVKFFLRISGDSPLIEPRIINKAIDLFKKNKRKYEIISNTFPKTFPRGQSVEIIKTSLLGKNIKYMSKDEKEHVTKYFYKNCKLFKILNFKSRKKVTMHQSVDSKKDLTNIKKKFKNILIKNIKNYEN